METDLYPIPGFHDPFSAMSHLFGAAVFVVFGVIILRKARTEPFDATRYGCVFVYAISCIVLFSMSGVYHMMPADTTARAVMGRLDHNAIFVLIAASFTPAHGILFRGWMRWGPLAFIWVFAVAGITLKTLFFESLPEYVGLGLYLAMGWCGAFSGAILALRYGYRFIRPLLWGGIAYSIGGTLDGLRWPTLLPGVIRPHEVFHVAVLVGALLHWKFNMHFADGSIGPA
ncbi:MAG: hemolysin III family protein [Gemmataceae bacterium]|nr:hemolysin III family protein [Gemmataceae bacterium]